MSQDGPQLPNIDVWRQIITEVQPKLVITTGTAGGIGKQFEVGDVIVSPIVRFDCIVEVQEGAVPRRLTTRAAPAKTEHFATAETLFKANAAQLPKDNTRPPKIVRVAASAARILRRDDRFLRLRHLGQSLQAAGLGDVSEMGDAVLGLVADEMGKSAPRWLAVRNVSDPADQGRRADPQAAGGAGGADLQGVRPLELGLQRASSAGRSSPRSRSPGIQDFRASRCLRRLARASAAR